MKIKSTVRNLIKFSSSHIPLEVYKRLMPRCPIGFFYHVVSDEVLPHVRGFYPYKDTVAFEQDLLYLKANYNLIGYQDLLASFLGQKKLLSNSAYISFDDGFIECATIVRPLLEKYDIPCIFFITSDFIDNKRLFYRNKVSLCIERLYNLTTDHQIAVIQQINQRFVLQLGNLETLVTWLKRLRQRDEFIIDEVCKIFNVDVDEFLRNQKPFMTTDHIRALYKAGFTVGAHSKRHLKLQYMNSQSQAQEIIESCRIISELVGANQVPFAFPFSGYGVDRHLLTDIRAQNPGVGLIFDTKQLRKDVPFVFHRIWVDKPIPNILPAQNIQHHIYKAYQQALVEKF